MVKLKPCPICGGKLKAVYAGGGWFWEHEIEPAYPICPITHSRKYDNLDELVCQINKRVKNRTPSKTKIFL